MRDYTQLNETYHYQLGDGLFVLDAFVDVELQRLAAHGIEKELVILRGELVLVVGDDGLLRRDVLRLSVCASATTRGASWCRGSWSGFKPSTGTPLGQRDQFGCFLAESKISTGPINVTVM